MVGGFGMGVGMMLLGRMVVGRVKRVMSGMVEGRDWMVERERLEMNE